MTCMNRIGWTLCIYTVLFGMTSMSCNPESETATTPKSQPQTDAHFTLLPPEQTGIHFSNRFTEDYNYNIFTFEYLYNGCGVATGDVNQDGLPDIYFSASFGPNKLYINLGSMKFLDVTDKAGVAAPVGFKTGVMMGDVNGDGRLDIYSCRTSKDDDGQKTDHVFIHLRNETINGVQVPVFEDQAVRLGLNDNHNTNHACLIDYDRDGDMDVFLLNHRTNFKESSRLRLKQDDAGTITRIVTPETAFESNQLFRNDRGRFTEVTIQAGLVSSAFGLSVTPADLNGDGWMDLYVANDYIEPDYIYINNRNGTFSDRYFDYLRHSSQNSMGADVTDINNDGLPDIMVLDMKAEHHIRYKELMNVMQFDRYNLLVQYGYGRQMGRNVLQLNNGNNTFSEVAQVGGLSATDWSWAPLIADYNLDGLKDIYITNGYLKDVLNLDYTNYFRDSISKTGGISPDRYPDIQEFLKHLPEYKATNYLYIQGADFSFIHANAGAGMEVPSYSNGASYADLDLDGDLDLIVNNIQDPAFIYQNDISGKSWLQIRTEYTPANHDGLGAQTEVYSGDLYQHQAMNVNKGFFSSSEPVMHFGLNSAAQVDSIVLTWPSGEKEIMKNVPVNQRLVWKKGSGIPYSKNENKTPATSLFQPVPQAFTWRHQENEFVDFKREKLLPYMLSAEGPCLAVGDLNGDQLDDVFVGNGAGFPASCWVQVAEGGFRLLDNPVFEMDKGFEDCGSVMDDVDGDGDLDVLVISGGNEAPMNADAYMTRLYRNDGKGMLSRVNDFPIIRTNAGCILKMDIDQDQDMDFIIGGKNTPGSFPMPSKSYVLIRENGSFSDATRQLFPDLEDLGIISDMETGDLNGDGNPEIVIAGEWMPVSIFTFTGKGYKNVTKDYGLDQTSGWWKSVHLADIDKDGDMDILAGNMGVNHRLRTSVDQPITIVSKDFDSNGSLDAIMCYYDQGKLYPFAGRDMIIGQLPMLKKKFLRYTPYAHASLDEIFSSDQLKGSTQHIVQTFQTTLFRLEGNRYKVSPLPYQVQWSPVYDFLVEDVNGDNRPDILMAGNYKFAETETGEIDAGNGVLLLQEEDGSFTYLPNREHGFWAPGEVRELSWMTLANGQRAILTGNNQGPLELHIVK